MIEAALYLALGCAAVSALAGCRAAWVLVPSVAFCLYADGRVDFDPLTWLMIDTAAMALIVGLTRTMTRADWLIFWLFFAAWGGYFLPDPPRYTVSVLVTIAQLLLTIRPGRMARLVERWKATFAHRHEWTDLERRQA